jgi:hypothetical protein
MFLKLFQILILVVVFFLVYNLIRFIFFLGRSSKEARKKMEEAQKEQFNNQNARGSGKNKIIELDKDQYHVD